MLKKIFQQNEQEQQSATNPAPVEAVSTGDTFKSLEDQLKELDEHLTKKLDEKSKSNTQAKDPIETSLGTSTQSDVPESQIDPDQETKEFIQLADFISKERSKKSPTKNPAQSEKIVKLQKYKQVKTKEFEARARQKGLQINKAA